MDVKPAIRKLTLNPRVVSLLELLMQINLRQGVHLQYLESGCNFEHDLGFRVFGNKHNLWPAWVDPKHIVRRCPPGF